MRRSATATSSACRPSSRTARAVAEHAGRIGRTQSRERRAHGMLRKAPMPPRAAAGLPAGSRNFNAHRRHRGRSRPAGPAAAARLLEPAAHRPDRAGHHWRSARTHRPHVAHHRRRPDHPRPLPRVRRAGLRDRPLGRLQRSHQLRLSPLHQPRGRDSPRPPAALEDPGDQLPTERPGLCSDPRLDRRRPARHRRRATAAPQDNRPAIAPGATRREAGTRGNAAGTAAASYPLAQQPQERLLRDELSGPAAP